MTMATMTVATMTMTMGRGRGRGTSRSRNLSGAGAGARNFKIGRLRQPCQKESDLVVFQFRPITNYRYLILTERKRVTNPSAANPNPGEKIEK